MVKVCAKNIIKQKEQKKKKKSLAEEGLISIYITKKDVGYIQHA